jgi:hypothetical protein
MGNLETFNIEHINRSNNSMNRVLVAEILIELTIAALIVVGAGPKINAPFHMMQTGLLPGRQFPQTVFPEIESAPLARRRFTLLPQPTVFTGHAPHGAVKPAGFAVIIHFTKLAADNPGLHPDTCRLPFGRLNF